MENNILINSTAKKRFSLSIIIIIVSVGLILTTLFCAKFVEWDTAFTAIIGLVGTWVGTVLAFYFSKENFDAASASTQKLVDSITTKDKLSTTKASSAMIPLSKIKYFTLEKEPKEYKLTEILSGYLKMVNRLPILNTDGNIYGIVHKSLIVEYITEQAIKDTKPKDLTLEHLINDSHYTEKILKGFSSVKEDESLITVKLLMEKFSVRDIICSDIFVTVDGTLKTKVIGWITNSEIAKHSIV